MRMGKVAKRQGIEVVSAIGEYLPFINEAVDFVLMVTTVCFLDDVDKSFREVYRILKNGGVFIIGLVDRESPLGQVYLRNKDKNPFYRHATFYSTNEIVEAMKMVGFKGFSFCQTIFGHLADVTADEPVRPGYGEGSFVVVAGKK